ncbi:MAG: hypothetical protein IT180_14800 [Acidobacteria bacterium]|nr:hypothetical protein [Acidobacteriota bacterium]
MTTPGATVLWRLRSPRREGAHAAVLPGGPPFTLAFFVAHQLDRVENYDTVDLAVFRADDVKRTLVEEGWVEE